MKKLSVFISLLSIFSATAADQFVTTSTDIKLKFVPSLNYSTNERHLVLEREPGILTNEDVYDGNRNFEAESYKRACNFSIVDRTSKLKTLPSGTVFRITRENHSSPRLEEFGTATSAHLIEFESVDSPETLSGSVNCFHHGFLRTSDFTREKVIRTMSGVIEIE